MSTVQRLSYSPKRKGVMPKRWTLEWFTVANAGNGQIALHSKPHNRFVRMNNGGFMDASSPSFVNKLPRGWSWERFTVVNAGNGQIALHNKQQNRFVRMNSAPKMDVSARKTAKKLPKNWAWERFLVVQGGVCKKKGSGRRGRRGKRGRGRIIRRKVIHRLKPGCTIALHNKLHNRFMRMNSLMDMDTSSLKAANKMPKSWTWERFEVVKAGNGEIALYSKAQKRFVKMTNTGRMMASPYSPPNKLPRNWKWERFSVVKAGNGQVALFNNLHKRFIRMTNTANMDASSRRTMKRLPAGWTWERFTVVRYACRKKNAVSSVRRRRSRRRGIVPSAVKPKKPKTINCPHGCKGSFAPNVAVRQYLNVGSADFTLKVVFKLKQRLFTAAALVFDGGNQVGLDPLFTRGTGRRGSWKIARQHGRGPVAMQWHCLVLTRQQGKVSGFLNGRFVFTRAMREPIRYVDIRPVRNRIWIKDFYFKRGWEANTRCAAGCGVSVGGKSLLQPRMSQKHDVQWRTDVVRSNAAGGEDHQIVNLIGSSKDGFLLDGPNWQLPVAMAFAQASSSSLSTTTGDAKNVQDDHNLQGRAPLLRLSRSRNAI